MPLYGEHLFPRIREKNNYVRHQSDSPPWKRCAIRGIRCTDNRLSAANDPWPGGAPQSARPRPAIVLHNTHINARWLCEDRIGQHPMHHPTVHRSQRLTSHLNQIL
ncbi:hypothetical protein J6590_015215 [Homalodisca vitripennis]|nr:hypothetical protein J6590_015215 [Homalodisca vitripennis]